MNDVDPSQIMQIGMGFWPSKTLLSAVELGVFSALAGREATGAELGKELGLHERGIADFFDGLVSIGMLERTGAGPGAKYKNTPATERFLDRKKPTYVGGILEMANARLYKFWGDLTTALKTGQPQNEIKQTGASMFGELYSDPARLEQFMDAMSGISAGNFAMLAEKFDFSRYHTLSDVGGATAQLSRIVARRHPHMKCTSLDLPVVVPIANRKIAEEGLGDRVTAAPLDFFAEPIPSADVVTMGLILHDWNLPNKMHLIRSAYAALPKGGALIAIENLIDDDRRKNVFGLMMSLNMLIEFGEAFDFTGADFTGWCKEAGFERVEVIHLAGPASAAIAYK